MRDAIRDEYSAVALEPERSFHFHTGRKAATMLGYRDEWLAGIPGQTLRSFASTGNPFAAGGLHAEERVVDIGCGAGTDSLIAAKMVAPGGSVIGVDMTPQMVAKAREGAVVAGLRNVQFRQGYAEALPIEDAWADVVISNGVLNLTPDKSAALAEMARVLKPGGRLQVGDMLVERAVPDSAKRKIDLWTG